MSSGTTRQQMVDTAVQLFQQHGYRATSWRTLVAASGTPWGSVQHHFPGGKEQLGLAAVERAGQLVEDLLRATLEGADDPVEGIRSWFTASAALLEAGDFADGCPVAPVVLEMAQESPSLAAACAEALARWVAVVAGSLREAGLDDATATALATTVISGFEGGLVLVRARRSAEPLTQVGEVLAATVAAQLPPA
jgi:TetR/AcrR family transcriptional repressor of lmrAB and yxaGH operons